MSGLVARDVLAAVGDVMLRWGFLESAMLNSIGESSPVRTPILQRWRTACHPAPAIIREIEVMAAIRNALAHGLFEVQSRPADGGEAFVRCRLGDGRVACFTFGEITETARALDRLRLQIAARNQL